MEKKVNEIIKKFDGNVVEIAAELKRVQSLKCRLLKCKGKKGYEDELNKILNYEQLLKESRGVLVPREKSVTNYDIDDVSKLSYEEVIKALRSIQSKKSLCRWLTEVEGDNDEFRKACEIEKMLNERKKVVDKIDGSLVRKSDVQVIIDILKGAGDLDKNVIIESLEKLVNNEIEVAKDNGN